MRGSVTTAGSIQLEFAGFRGSPDRLAFAIARVADEVPGVAIQQSSVVVRGRAVGALYVGLPDSAVSDAAQAIATSRTVQRLVGEVVPGLSRGRVHVAANRLDVLPSEALQMVAAALKAGHAELQRASANGARPIVETPAAAPVSLKARVAMKTPQPQWPVPVGTHAYADAMHHARRRGAALAGNSPGK